MILIFLIDLQTVILHILLNPNFSTAILHSDISDHLPVVIHFNLRFLKTLPISKNCKRTYSTESTLHFIHKLSMINLLEVCSTTNNSEIISDIIFRFLNIFYDVFEEAFLSKKFDLPQVKFHVIHGLPRVL